MAALAGFALAVVPALAADHSVKSVEGNAWDPPSIEIAKGDKVTWTNGDGGFHNVHFEDSSFTEPSQPAPTWTEEVSRTFDTAGTYRYVCQAHPNMKGTVVVKDPAATGTTTQTTTTGTTTQTAPAQTTTTTTTATTTEPTPPAPVVSVTATRSSFCARRSRRCRRPGVVLRITSDTAHHLQAKLARNGRAFGSVAFHVPAATKTFRFTRTGTGRRLDRGRYVLRAGTAAPVRFRVR